MIPYCLSDRTGQLAFLRRRKIAVIDRRPELKGHKIGGEFDLLLAFIEHPGRVLSRDQLLDLSRGREAQPFDRSIDVQVSRLRRKIEVDPASPKLIKTVWGGGYVFTPQLNRQ